MMSFLVPSAVFDFVGLNCPTFEEDEPTTPPPPPSASPTATEQQGHCGSK